MHKPMYQSVEDARKGKVSGSRPAAKLARQKHKVSALSDEETEKAIDDAQARLAKILARLAKKRAAQID